MKSKLLLILSVTVVACSDDSTPCEPGTVCNSATADTGTDTSLNSDTHNLPDVFLDTDSGDADVRDTTDAGESDATADGGMDGGHEPNDSGSDAQDDTGVDTGLDGDLDASPDTGLDAETDAEADSGDIDSGGPAVYDETTWTMKTWTKNESASTGTPDSYFFDVDSGSPLSASITGGGNGTWSVNVYGGYSNQLYPCSGTPSCQVMLRPEDTTVIITAITTDIGYYQLTVRYSGTGLQ